MPSSDNMLLYHDIDYGTFFLLPSQCHTSMFLNKGHIKGFSKVHFRRYFPDLCPSKETKSKLLATICFLRVSALAFAVQIYTGGIENVVRAWDLRRNAVIFTMTGHTDTITSMRVSPDHGGDFLLTNAMVSSQGQAGEY